MSNKSSALLALVFGLIPAFAIEVCAYPLDTFTPPTFNSGVSGVSIQSDQKLLLAGNFTMVAGVRRTYAARLNPDGTFDPSLGDPGGGTTHTLVQDANGKILMGGAFQFVGGGFHPNIARLNADGSIDPSFTANANGEVFGIYVQPDGKIFIWGTFTMVNGQNRSGVAQPI